MKNIFLSIIVIGSLLTVACNPMKDINDEIDKLDDAAYTVDTFKYARKTAPTSYTLTEDDYKMSSNENVAKYKNFSASALPKDFLPEILNKKFVAPNAFAMLVTYNYYSKPEVDKTNPYTISKDDYSSMGQGYGNFSDTKVAESLIGKLFDRKLYANEAGVEKTAKYILYQKNQTRYIKVFANGKTSVLDYDKDAYELTDADYESLGEGKYKSFKDIATAETKLIKFAADKAHKLPKVYACTVYKNYIDKYAVYYYNGTSWTVKQSLMAVTEPLNYKFVENDVTKSTWWADPAIKITLAKADYALNPETAKYSNFDLRSGKTPGTDDAKLVSMIGTILDTNYDVVDDQQYLVSYSYYDGGSGVATIRIIREAGKWSEYTEE